LQQQAALQQQQKRQSVSALLQASIEAQALQTKRQQ
jgi:hypothetical protein